MHATLEQPTLAQATALSPAGESACRDAATRNPDAIGSVDAPAGAPRSNSAAKIRCKTVIRPKTGWRAIDFAELFQYRELLWMLASRDIKVRYKQTALGVIWAVLQPVLTMIVFTLIFGRLAGLDKRIGGDIPYPAYALCALLPWQLFANSLAQAGNSLVGNQNLLKKVYFPRLVVPIA